MIRYTITLMLVLLFHYCFSQKHPAPFDASFFKNPHPKLRDTIVFEAIFCSIGENASGDEIYLLRRKGLLSRGDYRSAISFVPVHTRDTFYLPFRAAGAPEIKLSRYCNMGKHIIITAVVYREMRMRRHKPFFVIDKIVFV